MIKTSNKLLQHGHSFTKLREKNYKSWPRINKLWKQILHLWPQYLFFCKQPYARFCTAVPKVHNKSFSYCKSHTNLNMGSKTALDNWMVSSFRGELLLTLHSVLETQHSWLKMLKIAGLHNSCMFTQTNNEKNQTLNKNASHVNGPQVSNSLTDSIEWLLLTISRS